MFRRIEETAKETRENVRDGKGALDLSGKGIVNDNGTTYEVKAGDAILTRDKEFHSIENKGNVPIEMLAIVVLY